MTAYIVRRLFATLPVMAVVALFVFFLLRFAPGDPAAIIAGEDATNEAIEAVRAKLGLDRPFVEQFVVWLWALLQGDMGVSIFSNLPVTRLIAQRLEPTLALTLSTLLVAVALAIPAGVLAAWKARKLVDRVDRMVAGSEFKRQVPPIAKIGPRTAGIDYLYPRRRPRSARD